jgi:hypothetical protein
MAEDGTGFDVGFCDSRVDAQQAQQAEKSVSA